MSIDIRLPQITSETESGQLLQMKSYLYQLVEQLNWALSSLEASGGGSNEAVVSAKAGKPLTQEESLNTFASIKGLIIKSADIVEAYYDEVSSRLEGLYVAEATFPDGAATFIEETSKTVNETSTKVDNIFKDVQTITSAIAGIKDTIAEVNAYIRTGLLYYDDNGLPVYGVEVGQQNTVDGVETFDRYARFISNRLSFFDENDNEVAYISDYKLFIANVEVTISYTIGGLQDTVIGEGSVVTKYVGGDG